MATCESAFKGETQSADTENVFDTNFMPDKNVTASADQLVGLHGGDSIRAAW